MKQSAKLSLAIQTALLCSLLIPLHVSAESEPIPVAPTFITDSTQKERSKPAAEKQTLKSHMRNMLEEKLPALKTAPPAFKMHLMDLHDTKRGAIIARYQASYEGIDIFGARTNLIMSRDGKESSITGKTFRLQSKRSNINPRITGAWNYSAHELADWVHQQLSEQKLNPPHIQTISQNSEHILTSPKHLTEMESKHGFERFEAPNKKTDSKAIKYRAKPFYWQHEKSDIEELTPAYYLETGVRGDLNGQPHAYVYVISADTGEVLAQDDAVDEYESFQYRVFADQGGAPFDDPYGRTNPHPDGFPSGFLPTVPAPQTLIQVAEQSILHNDPWLADGATETFGNNVDAFFNSIRTADGTFDLFFQLPESSSEYRPQDGDFRAQITTTNTFDYFYNELDAPNDYVQRPPTDPTLPVPVNDPQLSAKIVNGFYTINYLHDLFYDLGFDEASGNAQLDNFGRGGIDGDPIIYNPSFALGIFIIALGDGESPVVLQGINPFSLSNRDAALETPVIAHEFSHYMVRRLLGGGVSFLNNTQGRALNEGWSDFLGIYLSIDEGDALPSANPAWDRTISTGGYVNRDYSFFSPVVTQTADYDPYFYGVRRYPYTIDSSLNPLSFRHIAVDEPLPAEVPINDWRGRSRFNTEVHAAGELWANTLWACYHGILNNHFYLTFAEKRRRMGEYLVSSLKATPLDPTYTEARNALLSVMKATDYGDYLTCKNAMVERGLGAGAISPPRDSRDLRGVQESNSHNLFAQNLIEVSLDDSIESFDQDGILDQGEKGLLKLKFRNTGFYTLPITSWLLASNSDYVADNAGFVLTIQQSQVEEDIELSIPIRLLNADSYAETNFKLIPLSVPGQFKATEIQLRTHYDLVQDSSSDDFSTVETEDNWTVEQSLFTTFHVADPKWRRGRLNGEDVIQAKEGFAGYDSFLVSPDLIVSTDSDFTMNLEHAYKLVKEADPIFGSFKGLGSIQYSIDGGMNWLDINELLPGRGFYSNISNDYPNFINESFNFGQQLAGQTVRIRFNADFAETFAEFYEDGWFINRVSFTGLTNSPFKRVAAD